MYKSKKSIICTNQKNFIQSSIKKGIRIDGRNLFDVRMIKINFGRYNSASTVVKLGKTCVHCNVSSRIIKSLADKPFEGLLKFKILFSGALKSGKDYYYKQRSEKINCFLEKVFKQSKILDLEAFNISFGEKTWSLTCSIFVVDDFGNALDCIFLAVLTALRSHKKFNNSLNTILHERSFLESFFSPIVFNYVPITITAGLLKNKNNLIQPFILLDPSLEEERYIDGTITYGIDIHGNILIIEKNGGLPLTIEQVAFCMQLCFRKACQINKQLKK